jgi:hypothetical protein
MTHILIEIETVAIGKGNRVIQFRLAISGSADQTAHKCQNGRESTLFEIFSCIIILLHVDSRCIDDVMLA